MPLSIAIDGPVGAGKSTIADEVARELGILHLDTGALYRALGLKTLRMNLDAHQPEDAEKMLAQTKVEVRFVQGAQQTLLDGEDVSQAIRTPEVSAAASAVSKHLQVRREMVALQQRIAMETDMVVDGRDIGTRVLPKATVKIYLTADAGERARRRYEEYCAKGEQADYQQVLDDLMARDYQDMHREVDPLRPAEDSIIVDSTKLSPDEVVRTILSHVPGEKKETLCNRNHKKKD